MAGAREALPSRWVIGCSLGTLKEGSVLVFLRASSRSDLRLEWAITQECRAAVVRRFFGFYQHSTLLQDHQRPYSQELSPMVAQP